jgi:hypothetical protein
VLPPGAFSQKQVLQVNIPAQITTHIFLNSSQECGASAVFCAGMHELLMSLHGML